MRPRVLVVDDDAAVRASLQKLLEAAGYEVRLASGGSDAVGWFERVQIDLLLLDLGLPCQNGWQVLERLRELQPAVPVIILTAMPNQARAARAARVAALLEKPLEAPALLKTMEELLAHGTCVA